MVEAGGGCAGKEKHKEVRFYTIEYTGGRRGVPEKKNPKTITVLNTPLTKRFVFFSEHGTTPLFECPKIMILTPAQKRSLLYYKLDYKIMFFRIWDKPPLRGSKMMILTPVQKLSFLYYSLYYKIRFTTNFSWRPIVMIGQRRSFLYYRCLPRRMHYYCCVPQAIFSNCCLTKAGSLLLMSAQTDS